MWHAQRREKESEERDDRRSKSERLTKVGGGKQKCVCVGGWIAGLTSCL